MKISLNYKTHNMRLNPSPFEAIKAGIKTIEVRLNDEKRKTVRVGDTIIFTRTDGQEQIAVMVLARHECKTFRELYEKFPSSCFGSGHNSVEERIKDTYANYYTKEQEEKNGVLGIEIQAMNL